MMYASQELSLLACRGQQGVSGRGQLPGLSSALAGLDVAGNPRARGAAVPNNVHCKIQPGVRRGESVLFVPL